MSSGFSALRARFDWLSPSLPLPEAWQQKAFKLSAAWQLWIALMLNLLSLAVPIMMLQVYDRIIPHQAFGTLTMLIIGVTAALMLDALLRMARAWLMGWTAASNEHAGSCAAMERFVQVDMKAFDASSTGMHLQNVSALGRLREFYSGQALTALIDVPFALIFLVLIAYIGGWLVVVPLIMLGLFGMTARHAGTLLKSTLEARGVSDNRKTSYIISVLSGMHTVKGLAMEMQLLRRFEERQDDVTQASYRVAVASGVAATISAAFNQLSQIITVTVGCVLVLHGYLSMGSLSACTLLAGRCLQPVQRVMGTWLRLQDFTVARAHAESIFALPAHARDTSKIAIPQGRVSLREVVFGYEGADPVFTSVSLEAEPGEVIAISGDKGAGKSTLLQLIAGALAPQAGKVWLDDMNPATRSMAELHSHVGYLPQQATIFKGTILENMTGFKSEEEIIAISKHMGEELGLDAVVNLLPRGYATMLSGNASDPVPPGVKQRIALARVLRNMPAILLFDDADSALDKEGYTIGLLLLVFMIILQGAFFFQQKQKAEASRQWVSHTYEVLNAIRTPFAKIKDAQIGQRGFMLSGNEDFLEPYYAAMGNELAHSDGKPRKPMGYVDTHSIADNMIELRGIIKDNAEQSATMERLESAFQSEIIFINTAIDTYRKNPEAGISLVRTGKGKDLMDNIRVLITEMLVREKDLLDKRLATDKEVEDLFTWSIIAAAFVTYGGLLIAIMLITRNFTRIQRTERQLKSKEADFHAAAEGGMDAFFIFHAKRSADEDMQDLSLQYMNPIAERMLGMRLHSSVGMSLAQVLTYNRAMDEAGSNLYKQVLISGKASEMEYTISEGALAGRSYQEQVVPLPEGIAVSCRDITDRKAVERLKNEFVSTVSHELRTPLTSIRGSLGLILGSEDENISGDTKDLLSIAYNNCERLVRLINDILDIEKIESGRMVFECRPLTLMPMVRQAMDANRAFADKYGVKVVMDEEASAFTANAQVMADGDRLMQVLTNLLSNAIKFSPQGSNVSISCREQGEQMMIAVRDHGSGIPDEFRHRVFQKFAQADSSDTRQKGGTGLGLSIVKTIVEEMKGVIGFESEAGEGTVFYFTLPIAQQEHIVTPVKATSAAARILVCEDEADIANLLQIILERAGFAVDIAPNAATAHALLKTNTYLAMTLDLMLPDKSGVDFIRELRADAAFYDLPIIVVSAKAEEGRNLLNGDAINIVDWMHKPIDVKRLVGLVQNLRIAHRARILHVEDDNDIADILRLALAKVADVTCAPTLHKARLLLQTQDFDLVVLDVGLPDGEGTELLPLLGSEARRSTPVILFTAAEVSQEVSALVAASLTKSRTSEEKLLDTIRDMIAGNYSQPREKSA